MPQHLQVRLQLGWQRGDQYIAHVQTLVPDTCYQAVSIRQGPPRGITGLPEMAYVTAEISHDGVDCAPIVWTIDQLADGVHSTGKELGVTAFVVLEGEVVGMAHQLFPRGREQPAPLRLVADVGT